MAQYVQSLIDYLRSFGEEGDSILRSPMHPTLDGPVMGMGPNNYKVGRVPFPLDVYGWFANGVDIILNPRRHAPQPQPPPAPQQAANRFPADALVRELFLN